MIKESLNIGFRIAARPTALAVAQRSFTGNTKKLDEKEKGDEQIFFKRQEGKPHDKDTSIVINHVSLLL